MHLGLSVAAEGRECVDEYDAARGPATGNPVSARHSDIRATDNWQEVPGRHFINSGPGLASPHVSPQAAEHSQNRTFRVPKQLVSPVNP